MNSYRKEARECEILILGNKLPESNSLAAMKTLVASTDKLVEGSIKQVRLLDTLRNLNTLGTRKTNVVKLP